MSRSRTHIVVFHILNDFNVASTEMQPLILYYFLLPIVENVFHFSFHQNYRFIRSL